MYDCLITFRSVMPAQRAEEILQGKGIACTVRRTPKWMERQGCGYSLRLGCAQLPKAVQILEKEGIGFRKLYRQKDTGKLEEMIL